MVKAAENSSNSSTNQHEVDGESSLSESFKRHLNALHGLCDDLEAVADSLPISMNVQASLALAQNLLPTIKAAHEFEENSVYSILDELKPIDRSMREDLERLKFEHWVDEDLAEEILHKLHNYVAEKTPTKAEALSWMLRGFFEGMRRHIAFDLAIVLPALLKTENRANG